MLVMWAQARRPVHELCLDLDERLSERQNDPLNAHVVYVSNLSSKPHRHEDQLQTFRQFGPIQRVTSAAEHAGKHGRHAFISAYEYTRAPLIHLGNMQMIWWC